MNERTLCVFVCVGVGFVFSPYPLHGLLTLLPPSSSPHCYQARARDFESTKEAHAKLTAAHTALQATKGSGTPDATKDAAAVEGVVATTSVTWTASTGEQHETSTVSAHQCDKGDESSRYTVTFEAPNGAAQVVALVELQDPPPLE